jgi:glutathionylspermidine synthase
MSSYDDFARRLRKTGILLDPWIDGQPRFREAPLILEQATYSALTRAAEEVGALYAEAAQIVSDAPKLLDTFYGLTQYQKLMWLSSEPLWHGLARVDVFEVADGLCISEINCDTPTGEAEAVVLGELARAAHPDLLDPNQGLERRFVAMIEALANATLDSRLERAAVGLLYPTDLTEDLPLVRLYTRWLERRGLRVVHGSPFNLTSSTEGPRLFGERVDVILRHYKTDWWGERASAWDDDDVPDKEPLARELGILHSAMAEAKAVVVNPFGSVLTQNKRTMALFWEHLHRFSTEAQTWIERYVPVTSRLETVHEEQLAAQKDEWVIKSDYGAEGSEVIVGCRVSDVLWKRTIDHARPGRWIAQRYFHAKKSADDEIVNWGVYLVAGRAAGLYARVQTGPTDEHAASVPVLVKPLTEPG